MDATLADVLPTDLETGRPISTPAVVGEDI